MAGKHISEANAATIEALHKLLEVGVHGNILMVDTVKGNDTKAATDSSIPYKTITAAKTVSTSGTTIIVMPGTYDEGNLAKDAINYFFMPGAKVIYTGAVINVCIFADNNTVMALNVYGYGEFINNGTGGGNDVVHTEAIGTTFNIECIKIHSEINRAVGNDESTVIIRCKEISSGDGVIDTAGGSNGNAKTIIYANKIEAINNYAIEHDGGDVRIYADEIISNSDSFETITIASGAGSLVVNAKTLISNQYGIGKYNSITTVNLNGIKFNCANLDIADDSSTPNLITVDNCSTANGTPYLKGIAGLNYVNRPDLVIDNNDDFPDGYEPNKLFIHVPEIGSGIAYLTIPVPSNYFFEFAHVIDRIGTFSSEGFLLKVRPAEEPALGTQFAQLTLNITETTTPYEQPNQYAFSKSTNIYIDADGDDITGLELVIGLRRSLLV